MKKLQDILLVEDDDFDAKVVKRAFKDLNITNSLILVKSGREAIEYLEKLDTKLPGMILLDINMPIMDGIEFLKEKNQNPDLRLIPTTIVSTSDYPYNRVEAYKHGAVGYILKSIDYSSFLESIKTISNYWTLSIHPTKD